MSRNSLTVPSKDGAYSPGMWVGLSDPFLTRRKKVKMATRIVRD